MLVSAIETLIDHLHEANPRMAFARDGSSSVPRLGVAVHASDQPLASGDEVEHGRFFGFVAIRTGVEPDSGVPMRTAPADTTSMSLVEVATGYGVIVVTDRRLIGSMGGESRLADISPKGGQKLVWMMDYEDMDALTLVRRQGMVGGVKERRVAITALHPMGVMVHEADSALQVVGDRVESRRLKTARPLFEAASRAAAQHLLTRGPGDRDRGQLERVLRGEYETAGQDLVAQLVDSEG